MLIAQNIDDVFSNLCQEGIDCKVFSEKMDLDVQTSTQCAKWNQCWSTFPKSVPIISAVMI